MTWRKTTATFGLLLTALMRESKRHRESLLSLRSLSSNHFFLFISPIIIYVPPAGMTLFAPLFLVALPILSRDPMHFFPKARLALFPLTPSERNLFPLLSRFVNPLLGLVLVLGLIIKVKILYFAPLALLLPPLADSIATKVTALRPLTRKGQFWKPQPAGSGTNSMGARFQTLYLHTLRTFLHALDPYLALVITLWALPECRNVQSGTNSGISMLILLALSTQTHCLLICPSPGEALRMRLLPLRGWQLLLVKDFGLAHVVPALGSHI